MIRLGLIIPLTALTLGICGCGCGDRAASRQLTIVEVGGVSSGEWGPMVVDTSQLPPGSVRSRSENDKSSGCYSPKSILQIFPNCPIKVLIVPATQPAR